MGANLENPHHRKRNGNLGDRESLQKLRSPGGGDPNGGGSAAGSAGIPGRECEEEIGETRKKKKRERKRKRKRKKSKETVGDEEKTRE